MGALSVVVMDASGRALRQTDDWSADVAYGADEQRFAISHLAGPPLSAHMRWQVDGTALAGVVDDVCLSVAEDGSSSVSYEGRTVQGVLAGKVLLPPSGSTHLTATGDLNECIRAVVQACGLSGYLTVPSEASGFEVSGYRYRRFVDAYTGLRMLCASVGARLRFLATGDGIALSAVAATTYGELPSERVAFEARRTYRPCNRMVGLGGGEGTAREVVHWYADEAGALSQTQTLFGLAEVAQTYDHSGSDDLSADTRAKLAELQGQGTFDAYLPEGAPLDVGDVVTVYDADTGDSVEAQVTKVIVKVSLGEASTDYEAGEPQWPEDEE